MTTRIVMKPRMGVANRTSAALARAYKVFNPGSSRRPGGYDLTSLIRIHDMNSLVFICAMQLLDANIPEDPDLIRDSREFGVLIGEPKFKAEIEARGKEAENLLLLEVFTYMIIIHKAREKEYEQRAAIKGDLII
jgi:hypothetical protein